MFLFESAYIGQRFRQDVGSTTKLTRIVLNGISEAELVPVRPNDDAADFVYVGEWRSAKGIDTLIDALALMRKRHNLQPTLVLVGSGPDEAILYDRAAARCVARPDPLRSADAGARSLQTRPRDGGAEPRRVAALRGT